MKILEQKTLGAFLAELRHLDIRLWIEGDRLRYKATKDTLTPELLAELRDRKTEILGFLKTASLAAAPNAIAIPIIPRTGDLPLSIAQERLWYHHQFEPDSSLNNIITAFHLKGKLDIDLLDKAQHEIVQRHEILRTTFPKVDGKPTVAIAPRWNLNIPVEDLQSISADKREEEAHRRAIAESRRPYDLEKGPLLRLRLLQLAPDDYRLVLTMHRMMADGVSVDIFFREMVTLYKSYLLSEPEDLPDLPIQYVDYAHWQRQRLQGEFLETRLNYWKDHLKAPLPVISLPISHPRPSTYSFNTQRRRLIFPKALNDALNTLSQQEEATLFMTLMAALKVLLHRYSEQEDIIICCSNAGRNQSEVQPLVGPFFNTLALRTHLNSNLTFRDVIGRVKQVTLGAFDHQELPFEQLVPELNTGKNRGRSSLFQIFFALNPSWRDGNTLSTVELPDITFDTMFGYLYTGKTKFDLFLVAREAEEGLQLLFEYNSDLFDSETILPMMDHFQTLLKSAIDNPDAQISQLSLLTSDEQQQLLASSEHIDRQYFSPCTPEQPNTKIEPDLPKTQVYILDREYHPVPIGALGELYIDEIHVSQHHLNQPEPNDIHFIPHPLINKVGTRLYKTGTIARYRADGNIELFNRLNPELVAEDQLDQTRETTYSAARDELEQQLTQIWEKVFDLQSIGIQDNFFNLGGHSLLAVRLFAQIETVLGKNLPLSVLLQAPTIEQLADVLRKDDNDAAWAPLVEIQAGNSNRPPLFCIHGGGFNVLVYRYLALNLSTDQPVYGLQAQGLHGRGGVGANRLEDIAADYIGEIRTIQPQGPYYLSGLSNGGNIALEMAQQLDAAGEEVAFLGMFDSYGPEGIKLLTPLPRFLSSLKYVVRHKMPELISKSSKSGSGIFLVKLQEVIKAFSDANSTPIEKLPDSTISDQQVMDEQKAKRSTTDLPSDRKQGNVFEKSMNVFSSYVLAHSSWSFFKPSDQLRTMDNAVSTTLKQLEKSYNDIHKDYVLQPYLGKIVLFRAAERPPGYWLDPNLGWGSIAKDGVEVYYVPGHHTSIMTSPVLAKKVQNCLDDLQKLHPTKIHQKIPTEQRKVSSGLAGQ